MLKTSDARRPLPWLGQAREATAAPSGVLNGEVYDPRHQVKMLSVARPTVSKSVSKIRPINRGVFHLQTPLKSYRARPILWHVAEYGLVAQPVKMKGRLVAPENLARSHVAPCSSKSKKTKHSTPQSRFISMRRLSKGVMLRQDLTVVRNCKWNRDLLYYNNFRNNQNNVTKWKMF